MEPTRRILGSLALSAGIGIGPAMAETPEWLQINLHHETHYDSLRKSEDINFSDIQLIFGAQPVNLPEYLRLYQDPAGGTAALGDWRFELSARLSGAPYLLQERTKDDLHERIDEALALSEPRIRQGVAFQLSQMPGFSSLPPQAQQQLIDQQTSLVVEGLRTEHYDLVDERVDEIRAETAIQELALTAAGDLDDGATQGFVRIGKFKPELGPRLNNNLRSELESMRPINSRTQRMTTTFGTGAAAGGLVHRGDGYSLRGDLVAFHRRLPWISAEDYIANVVTLDEDDYDHYKTVWEIDSVAARLQLRRPDFEVHLTLGDYDGDFAWATGTVVRLGPADRIFADYSQGDRENLERGLSLAYAHQITAFSHPLDLYLGYEGLKQALIRAQYNAPVDVDEVYAGAGMALWTGRLLDQPSLLDASLEAVYQEVGTGASDDEIKRGLRGSLQFQMNLE